jgi:Methyltransferase domain
MLPAALDRVLSRFDVKDWPSRAAIYRACRGYSTARQWKFFRSVLRDSNKGSICVLGVYFGRDIASISWLLRRRGGNYDIVGVDLFADVPGTDWPEEKRGLSWQQAGFGPAPNRDIVRHTLHELDLAENVELVSDSAQHFLSTTNRKFDFIYLDVAHDYKTTRQCIELALTRLNPDGVIAGDDFSNAGTWGVAKAVAEFFPQTRLFGQSIWWVYPAQQSFAPRL